ncbi:YhfC family intramembrane metalloprotease [Paraburkholderia sp. DHOC27]|uniref:YhfC family intramembrane metalloprotease n=1 Tax=Paraburkholderia sp. DHOC27 TaxID=2303330 RepID=UPI000E3B71EF|nr:YhfC family intramembrane metalloprotease [Paraburkholderia sp. DHOC27]RFU45312.1 DUF2324 domain-containing protein [Paraburkholderia sp. DHOC27]
MVVSPLTLTSLSLATLFVAILPVVLYRRLCRPLALSGRDVISGIAVFALFAMVIERSLNAYVLQHNELTVAWLSNPLAFVIYGALIAGVCEEGGRYIAMRLLWRRATTPRATTAVPPANDAAATDSTQAASPLNPASANARAARVNAAKGRITKRNPMSAPTSTGDGTALGYGLGHGGAEAWIVGVLVQIQWIVFAVIENRGELDTYLGNVSSDSLMRIHLILASLSPQMAGIFVLERVAALIFQVGLSLLMWRGIRAGWRGILPLAIAVHALIDVPAALFQAKILPLYAVDALYALMALIVAGVLVKQFRRAALTTQAA